MAIPWSTPDEFLDFIRQVGGISTWPSEHNEEMAELHRIALELEAAGKIRRAEVKGQKIFWVVESNVKEG